MEQTAANGQKKQAVEVNKHRKWEGGETIPKGTVCLLKLSQDKNSVGVKESPVVITSLHYYKQSGNIRYKVASKGWGGEAHTPSHTPSMGHPPHQWLQILR
jgi:hypothetical protein